MQEAQIDDRDWMDDLGALYSMESLRALSAVWWQMCKLVQTARVKKQLFDLEAAFGKSKTCEM